MSQWRDGADERLAQVIADELGEPVMVTGFVLVAEFLDQESDRRIAVNAAPDQRASTTLGLIAYADAVERANVVRDWHDDG